MTTHRSAEPSLTAVLLGLTAVTGIIDATSYLGLGHVFTANMTGNIALMGFAVASAQGLSVKRSGAALVAFLVGAVIGGRMSRGMSAGPRHRWIGFAFGWEAALYALAVGAALADPNVSTERIPLYAVIVLTGLAMGIRNATVRRLGVPDLTTTVLTLTLAGLAADSRLGGGSGSGWQRRTGAVVCTIVGAAMGTWLLRVSVAVPLAVCAVVTGFCAFFAHYGMAHKGLTERREQAS